MTPEQARIALKNLHAEVAAAFDAGESGHDLCRRMSEGVDRILVGLWRKLAPSACKVVDLLAVGGYGRAELAPFSDWDIWLLVPEKAGKGLEDDIQAFLYALWDAGGKIGYAVRTPSETMEHIHNDWDAATAALEARLLDGQGHQYRQLQPVLQRFFRRQRRRFVRAKLEEMNLRHQRAGDTAFLMEPDVKEGMGGLRDGQAIFWMARGWYGVHDQKELVRHGILSAKELSHLADARDFLLRCRVGLHLENGRAADRLSFEMQLALAERMGYESELGRPTVEVFMKDYFRHAGRMARVSRLLTMHFDELLNPKFFARIQDLGDGFTLQGDRVGIVHANVFREDPLRLLRIFHVAQEGRRHLSSTALRQIREDVLLIDDDFRHHPDARESFLAILRARRNVHWTLKQMNDTGILGRYIPEFRHVVGLGQFNRYHAYTVDEHTIRAVGEARNFIHGERQQRLDLAHEVVYRIHRPELLYLALIFHDIAKGMEGDHSENGARLARAFCQRLQLDVDATALVEWLVREHLTMAVTSQRCDLADPEVVRRFADTVGNLGRLYYLLLLTVADIAAVGPGVWNDWKGSLLKELFQATERYLAGQGRQSQAALDTQRIRMQAARDRLLDIESHLLDQAEGLLPHRCVAHFPPHQLARILHLLAHHMRSYGVETWVDSRRGETLVIVLAPERPGLLAMLADAVGGSHVNIIAAQAFRLRDGRALDVFHIQSVDGQAFDEASDLGRIREKILKVLDTDQGLRPPRRPRLKRHILMEHVPVRVRHLPDASSRHTAIEVVAADRPGLLAELTYAISQEGYNIRNAAISTFGERVVDVFFLHGEHDRPLAPDELEALIAKLSKVAKVPEVQ